MTQTLTTTDELKHLASSDNTNELTRSLARECLANREAQPVGYIAEVSGNRVGVLRGLPMPDVGSLIYTAPPAPAVVNGRTAEGWMAEALLQKKIADDVRKSAPAVPDAISTRQAIANMERHELSGSINVAYKHGWNDFRAAMLAQPVSQGYKLPPHAYRELVNSLRDTAVKYSGTDQIRERLNTVLSQFIEPDHPHTRTTEPDRN